MSRKEKFVDLDVEGAEIVQQMQENPETIPSDYSEDTNADPEGVATRNNDLPSYSTYYYGFRCVVDVPENQKGSKVKL